MKIYKRTDNRYEIRYAYGLRNNGVTNYKSVYGKTEEEVLKKYENEIDKKIKENNLLFLDKSYLGHYIYIWLNSAKIKCKKTTFSNYEYTVNSRIIPKFSMIKKKNITRELIDNYTSELLNEGLLPKSVKDILIILQQILRLSDISIKITMPKIPKKEIQILKKDEQIKLEQSILEDLNITTFGIYFCLYTGLRIGELCALKWENIDIENKKISVKKTITRIKNPDKNSKKKTIIIIEEPKSISSIRDIPIPDFMIPILKKFKDCNINPNCFFINGKENFMETRTYFNHYKKIIKKLGLEYNFHALRHTFATRCIENGCDPKTLSEILGHSNVKITLEKYVHPNYENKVKVMNQIKPLY